MRTGDWFTIAGAVVFAIGLMMFSAALRDPSPPVMPNDSPKQFLDAFNVVRGVGSVWAALGTAAAGLVTVAIGPWLKRRG
jgi:hypothetical protein